MDQIAFFDSQIDPEWWCMGQKQVGSRMVPEITMLSDDPDQARAGFYLSMSLIRLMENVYLDLHLEQGYNHPDNLR